MNKLRLTKYIQKELIEIAGDEFTGKDIILTSAKLTNVFVNQIKNNGYDYNEGEENFYEKELDEIIQFNAWEVLSEFDNQQAANDDLSEDERMRLQNLGVNLAA